MLVHRHAAVSKVLHSQLTAWGYEVVDRTDASAPPVLRLGLVEASAVDQLKTFATSFPTLPLIAVASLRKPFDIFDAVRNGAWACVVLQDIHAVRDAVGTNRPKPGDVDPLWRTIERCLDEYTGEARPAPPANATQEHLSTVRALTKGMGDRINNPLTIVKTAVESVRDALADLKPSPTDLELIGEIKTAVESCAPAIERIHALSRGLRAFAMPVSAVLGNLDIARLIRDLAPDAEVTGPTELRVFANEHALHEAFEALLANARESYADGVTERPIAVTIATASPMVTIDVTDRGGGMSDDTRDRAFEPFFSHGKGPGALGLGLTLARDRIVAMRGEITLTSVVGAGTTVRVRLPGGT